IAVTAASAAPVSGTSVAQILPSEFKLSQNYPNPFNPVTTIEYSIPPNVKGETVNVTLKVYDVLGREVATLVDEYKQAGTYNSQFSILNSQLTTGVYFYRLTTPTATITKKMMLLK
ncbi:MAG: T9SS type A sorting domain-containing protein, partial [Bacteroidota bacterium]